MLAMGLPKEEQTGMSIRYTDVIPSYLCRGASTNSLEYRRGSFSHFQEVCPTLGTSLIILEFGDAILLLENVLRNIFTPVVDPKSEDAYQDLLGIDSCATAVIVHSMCRLVYGDITEGKK
jgi:hypothetical protein